MQQLEILEASDGGTKGSLYEFLNYCKTAFGKRHMKRWIVSPLNDVEKLNARLDAVEDLMIASHEAHLVRH